MKRMALAVVLAAVALAGCGTGQSYPDPGPTSSPVVKHTIRSTGIAQCRTAGNLYSRTSLDNTGHWSPVETKVVDGPASLDKTSQALTVTWDPRTLTLGWVINEEYVVVCSLVLVDANKHREVLQLNELALATGSITLSPGTVPLTDLELVGDDPEFQKCYCA